MPISVVAARALSQPSANTRTMVFDGSYVPQLNDLIVLWGGADAIITSIVVAAGWVNVLGGTTFVTSDANVLTCYYHWVTAGEVTAVQQTYSAANMFSPARAGIEAAVALRGVDTVTPVDDFSSTFDSTDTVTPHVLPGLAGANLGSGSFVMSCIYPDGNESYTTPTGWTQQISQVVTLGRNVWVGSRDASSVAGATISDTSITPSGGDEYCAITLALTSLDALVIPSSATLTLTGSAARLDSAIHPSGGSLTLTGSTPAGPSATLTPAGASLALTGAAPSLGARIVPTAGALTLTSSTPTVINPLAPAGLSLTLIGSAPSVLVPKLAQPTGASLTLTGASPTPMVSIQFRPTGAALVLTGSTPTPLLSVRLTPTPRALTLSGAVPTVTWLPIVTTATPSGAVMTLAGVAPGVRRTAPVLGGSSFRPAMQIIRTIRAGT